MRLAASCIAAFGLLGVARAQGDSASDRPFPLTVAVGESVALCATGTIICPAGAAACDDPSVARPESDPERGLAFKGLKPGTTLRYSGIKDGEHVTEVFQVTTETVVIEGVTCVVVHDNLYSAGLLLERTSDWYAQDVDGNVWYFGEDTAEVVSLDESVTVPFGSFDQCLETKEFTPLEPDALDAMEMGARRLDLIGMK